MWNRKFYINLIKVVFVFSCVFLSVNNISANIALKEADIIESIRTESGLSKDRFDIKYIGKDIFLGGIKSYQQQFIRSKTENKYFDITQFDNSVIIDKEGYVFALNLKATKINTTNSISKLKKIRVLSIRGSIFDENKFSDISRVWTLPRLEELDLFDNRIKVVAPKKDIRTLRYLDLGSNDISDISNISKLKSLSFLDLGNNMKINSLQPLSNLLRRHLKRILLT